MIGLDTSFLVAAQDEDHPHHQTARLAIARHVQEGFVLAPQVISEFVHVITDGRRFPDAISVPQALETAKAWWTSGDVRFVWPDRDALELFTKWMQELALGRKQILDTLLAATYKTAGVALVATIDFRDFGRYPGMHPLTLG